MTAYPLTEGAVATFLSEMGSTPDAIREYLRRAGVTGRREDLGGCPVAVALRARFPEAGPAVTVCTKCRVGPVYVETPPAVAAFIGAFDSGEYPELASDVCQTCGHPVDRYRDRDPDLPTDSAVCGQCVDRAYQVCDLCRRWFPKEVLEADRCRECNGEVADGV